jgi:hypothetical protein
VPKYEYQPSQMKINKRKHNYDFTYILFYILLIYEMMNSPKEAA